MRKAIGVLASCAALTLIALQPGSASGVPQSGIKGVVLDTTCAGPCIVGQQPQPYAGSDLRVVIRRLPGQGVVRRLSPESGRFSTRLRPGLYRVNAYVGADCWRGEARRVRVGAEQFRQITLHVQNSCILCACTPCQPCPPCPVYTSDAVICPLCPPSSAAVVCGPCPPGQVCITG
jgi:hypothetical protein